MSMQNSTAAVRRCAVRCAPLLALLVLLAACNDATAPAPPGVGWESVTTRSESGGVRVEDVTYRSGTLLVAGRVCRPASAGARSALIWNHGGFDGLGPGDDDLCVSFAQLGYAVLMSSYRGEDSSEGSVEVCLGEVDDVLALVEIAREQPYVNASRLAMAGASHGGCITLRAVQRGAQVVAAVAMAAPTDWEALYEEYADSASVGAVANRPHYQSLINEMVAQLGGTPSQMPAAYAARSPARFGAALVASARPVLIQHGTLDELVLPSQACLMAAAMQPATLMNVLPNGAVQNTAPAPCAGAGLTWSSGPRPVNDWPAARYLLMYQGVGHELDGAVGGMAANDAVNFLITKTPG
jgi:dienelactone hydrolase